MGVRVLRQDQADIKSAKAITICGGYMVTALVR